LDESAEQKNEKKREGEGEGEIRLLWSVYLVLCRVCFRKGKKGRSDSKIPQERRPDEGAGAILNKRGWLFFFILLFAVCRFMLHFIYVYLVSFSEKIGYQG
jgi:hypothetical protein